MQRSCNKIYFAPMLIQNAGIETYSLHSQQLYK